MGKKKLTDKQVVDIRQRAPRESYAVLASEYGVSISHISYINTGKRRKRGAGK
jgi:hypothetical protein